MWDVMDWIVIVSSDLKVSRQCSEAVDLLKDISQDWIR